MNPTYFLAEHDEVPFNFGMTVADFDKFWHDPAMPDLLKGTDPCTWNTDIKTRVDRQAQQQIDLYEACSRGEHNHIKLTHGIRTPT